MSARQFRAKQPGPTIPEAKITPGAWLKKNMRSEQTHGVLIIFYW